MSNFSVCHNVFKSCLLQRCQKASICGKGFMLSIMTSEMQDTKQAILFCIHRNTKIIVFQLWNLWIMINNDNKDVCCNRMNTSLVHLSLIRLAFGCLSVAINQMSTFPTWLTSSIYQVKETQTNVYFPTWLTSSIWLTLSHIRQICSRRLWTHFVKK